MTNEQRQRLWRDRRSQVKVDEWEGAIAGDDLYERNLVPMNHCKCDYHTATVFRLPLNEIRSRGKSLRRRVLERIGLV